MDFTDRLNRNLTGKLLKTLLRAASKFKMSLALKLTISDNAGVTQNKSELLNTAFVCI